MSTSHPTPDTTPQTADDGRGADLRDSPMMAHLLDALEAGVDIGHFGRLTFAMIARHFLDAEALVQLLANQPGQTEAEARALVLQVQQHDYSPPRRDRILEWQARQDFPICPTPDDPASCNVYRELRFPPDVYEHLNEFSLQRAESERNAPEPADESAGRERRTDQET